MDISVNYSSSRRFYLGINKMVKRRKDGIVELIKNYCEIKWDKIAKPILWSHDMHIILYCLFTKGKDNVKNYGRI